MSARCPGLVWPGHRSLGPCHMRSFPRYPLLPDYLSFHSFMNLLLNLACWRWCRLFQCKHHAKQLSQGLLSSLESVHSHSSLKEHSTVQYLGENSVLLTFPRDRSLKMMASWELAGKPQLPQINLYLKSTMAINTTESQFLKLWYSLHGATPPGGHLIGMWQPSIAVQQKGNCHMSFISFIWSLSPAR